MVRYVRIASCVGFVEGILRKRIQLFVDFLSNFLGDAIVYATGDSFAIGGPSATMDEQLAQVLHHLRFLFGHGIANVVGKSGRKTCKFFYQLHNLLLVDNTAVCYCQDRLHRWVQVVNFGFVELASDKVVDVLHWAGTIQGNTSDDFFQVGGLHAVHKVGHATTFKLEDTHCVATGNVCKNVLVGVIVGGKVNFYTVIFVDVVTRLFDVGKSAQAQKVHLQKA